MPRPTGPTDPNMILLAKKLRKNYPELSKHLSKPRRSKRAVNVGRLNKMANSNEVFAVPGRVLSVGELTKAVNVYACHFSKQAKEKISKAGGKFSSLDALTASKEKVRVVI